MKCSVENVILRGIFHVVSRFPLKFMLYRGNLDYSSDSVDLWRYHLILESRIDASPKSTTGEEDRTGREESRRG